MGTTAVAIMLPAAVFSRQARHVRAGRRHATVLPPAVNGWNAAPRGVAGANGRGGPKNRGEIPGFVRIFGELG